MARLTGLKAGETLWVSGAAKLGKSALLRVVAQQGTLLPGRSGRPFQTLAALVEGARFLPASSEGWLGLLRDHSGLLLLDDWELADPESRRVLLALAHSHAGPPLVISSRARSALGSHSGFHELSLRPLPQEVLGDALYAQTAGHPALLAAVQRSESLSEPVAALLSPLSPRARQLLICLCLHAEVGAADRQVVSAALQLSADDMTETLETLSRAGWLQEGQPVPLAALRSWLATQPVQEAEVLTLLVPHLKSERAFPLYLRAHDLSGSSDLPGFQEALQAHSRRLLDRGQDHRAEELLARHARGPAAQLLHARSLDGLGRYPDALKVLDALPSTPPLQALRGRVLFRLGEIAAARIAAQQALSGDLETRAQAYNLLGALALAAREYTQARSAFERAVGLFLLQGDELARLNALCSQAVAMTELGQDISAALHDISRLSERLEHPPTLLNIGWLLERQGDLPAALTLYGRAATLAEALRQSATAASAWNNVGVIHQKEGRSEAAAQAYQTAIGHAQQTGEIRTLAMVLGNLAELQDSLPLIEEALSLLQNAGQDDLAAYFEEQRQAFMARSGAL
ncbi:tetratricopeptide repeat protein [Deinococcus sp. KNUC1210]|uniref:tetratricopeptide repeat protein n=1 Tax=Deinococcus sp. KNUC1210 TaxID=2917691 RepID=UPI001EEFDB84|nr:tetratricopeptide repeat protein [Deinococcus sp. KNUC1210]ULH15076.1 tetratricopeptide repeat protein [Deinococcus sp. KNUC1210]